ncbi:MAG: 5'-nucleotidase C-terminal domain-containing protein [Saprospiraceae bacterium]|nr:5'-nucleotidase C-terminal domain-containing protein [Saprospiraceae bacterium]
MRKHLIRFSFLSFVLVLISCKSYHHLVSTDTQYIAIEKQQKDNDIENFIVPYREKIKSVSEEVIGVATKSLILGKPESLLGNYISDVLLEEAQRYSKNKVDGVIINQGSLRIPELPEGNVTLGKLFELMPFENRVVTVEMDGNTLQKFIAKTWETGGWPISKTINVKILNNKIDKILINKQLLDKNQTYFIATSDYIGNGGDKCDFLIPCKKTDLKILVRDVVIDHMKNHSPFSSEIDGRYLITNQ